jgi:TetR/AcrR family transcriptional repressor of nem operon
MTKRKQQILDIATELLQTKVFSALSFQDIADKLGLSKAAIHSHFRTKEILGIALLEQYYEVVESLHSKSEEAGNCTWDKYDAFISQLQQIIIEENKVCPMTLLQMEHHLISESMQELVSKTYNLDVEWLEKILTQGLENGEMNFRGTPKNQALLIIASLQGALINARAEDVNIFEQIMEQIKNSMKP